MQVRKTGMGNLSTRQVCSRETASLLAQAIVKLVGRKRTGRVMLVGCQHIDLLIQLAQHGFVDVTCLAVHLAGIRPGERSMLCRLRLCSTRISIVIELLDRGRQMCGIKGIEYREAVANGSRSPRHPRGRRSPSGMPVSKNCSLRVSSAR
jgi:hypothetical protein